MPRSPTQPAAADGRACGPPRKHIPVDKGTESMSKARQRGWLGHAALVASLFVVSCASPYTSDSLYTWVGRPSRDLIAAYGEPSNVSEDADRQVLVYSAPFHTQLAKALLRLAAASSTGSSGPSESQLPEVAFFVSKAGVIESFRRD